VRAQSGGSRIVGILAGVRSADLAYCGTNAPQSALVFRGSRIHLHLTCPLRRRPG
jgi:hypothetical protein